MAGTPRDNALASWFSATKLRTAVAAMLLAAVSSLLIIPVLFDWWHDDLRAGQRLADYMVSHHWAPISPGRVRLYMLYVPEWAFALPLGWLIGRCFYRYVVLAGTVCGACYVLAPWIFTTVAMGGANMGFFQVKGVLAGVVGRGLITFILVAGVSIWVGRSHCRRHPGWCSMCGRSLKKGEEARCLSCKKFCMACCYDLTGNTSGACPECGIAVAMPAAVNA